MCEEEVEDGREARRRGGRRLDVGRNWESFIKNEREL